MRWIGRALDNVRECNCPLRHHWWNAFWVIWDVFYWIPTDIEKGYVLGLAADWLILVVYLWLLVTARHTKPPKDKKKHALDKKWAALVASWRRPVAVPI